MRGGLRNESWVVCNAFRAVGCLLLARYEHGNHSLNYEQTRVWLEAFMGNSVEYTWPAISAPTIE